MAGQIEKLVPRYQLDPKLIAEALNGRVSEVRAASWESPLCKKLAVYLDGKKLEKCMAADADIGVAVIWSKEPFPHGDWQLVRGNVEIRVEG